MHVIVVYKLRYDSHKGYLLTYLLTYLQQDLMFLRLNSLVLFTRLNISNEKPFFPAVSVVFPRWLKNAPDVSGIRLIRLNINVPLQAHRTLRPLRNGRLLVVRTMCFQLAALRH